MYKHCSQLQDTPLPEPWQVRVSWLVQLLLHNRPVAGQIRETPKEV